MELKTENDVLEFWEKKKIYEKLMKREGKNFFFLDGPPYANFVPHVGHIKNTVFKDMLIRMNFMKGYNVLFQPGFDTHGLPVENMVEKKLGIESKKEIEDFGIDKFMQECKKNAALNKDLWMKVYKGLGSMYYLKEPYLTYENYYINSAWWAFAEMYKKKMVYEGEKPVMWCPHCETSLAGYETTDSYKDVQDPGIYVLFKLKDYEEYLMVYTTTPWTLPANVAIAIAPEEDYVKAEIVGKKIIVGEKRLAKLSEIGIGYSIIEKFKGKELVGKKYEPLLDVPVQKSLSKLGKAHEVVASISLLKERVASKVRTKKEVSGGDLFEEFVTMSEGTGMVHVAPGHGKTDFIVGQNYKLACVSPVDDKGEMKEESGFSGFVKKADKEILRRLEDDGKLLYQETITHSYPLCWRCKSPLIFRLSNQLFFKVDKVKEIIEKENKKVNWMPDFARERFDNWVASAEDWNISRQRYWGIPIPIWRCECGEEKVISDVKELEKLSKKKISDLHSVENISWKCGCGGEMKKFKGILDVWFDSGVAPWASLGYPYENKKLFEQNFPVQRINEAQDQIRGWFYSLMFCSCAVFEKPAYNSVSMTGWVVDSKGNKMSKSLGNVVSGEEGIEKLGGDILRYYFCWDVAPYELQKFNLDIAKKEVGRILNVLRNLKNLTGNEKLGKIVDLEDKWILSRLNNMMQNYETGIDKFEIKEAMRAISDFILDDLSRNYIKMTRDKENSAIITHCLENLLRLLAPVTPFITEEIWQDLLDKKIVEEESVHLSSWPKVEKKLIDNELEREFDFVLKIIEKGLAERDKAGIGLKWPLAKASIVVKENVSEKLKEIICNQLNVKKVEIKLGVDSEVIVSLDKDLTPELEAEGFARNISRAVQALRKKIGMVKDEMIELVVVGDSDLILRLDEWKDFLKERTNAKKIVFDKEFEGKDFVKDKLRVKEKEVTIFVKKI